MSQRHAREPGQIVVTDSESFDDGTLPSLYLALPALTGVGHVLSELRAYHSEQHNGCRLLSLELRYARGFSRDA